MEFPCLLTRVIIQPPRATVRGANGNNFQVAKVKANVLTTVSTRGDGRKGTAKGRCRRGNYRADEGVVNGVVRANNRATRPAVTLILMTSRKVRHIRRLVNGRTQGSRRRVPRWKDGSPIARVLYRDLRYHNSRLLHQRHEHVAPGSAYRLRPPFLRKAIRHLRRRARLTGRHDTHRTVRCRRCLRHRRRTQEGRYDRTR